MKVKKTGKSSQLILDIECNFAMEGGMVRLLVTTAQVRRALGFCSAGQSKSGVFRGLKLASASAT
jgi:hypothetical protein